MTRPPQDPHGTPSPSHQPGPPSRRYYELDAAPLPPSEVPFAPPDPPKRSNGPVIIGIAVGAVALACVAAGFFAIFAPISDDESASGGDEDGRDDGIVEAFDADNAMFWNTYDGIAQEKRSLEDGRFYHDETSDNARHIKATSDPVYSDVDSDGDLDVAMTLRDTGDPDADNGWSSIHIWLWEDGEITPVKEYASWQWDCTDPSLEVFPGSSDEHFDITRNTNNGCGDPIGDTVTVTVENETPVVLAGENRGATEACWVSPDDEQYVDLVGLSEPKVLPKSDAAGLGDTARQTKVEVSETDWDSSSFGGYVRATVTWDDGKETCDWVPWELYEEHA